MELVSLGRQSVYPRVYLASYRGISSAMETMRRSSNRNSVNNTGLPERQLRTGLSGGCLRSIAQRTRSGARSYWIGWIMQSAPEAYALLRQSVLPSVRPSVCPYVCLFVKCVDQSKMDKVAWDYANFTVIPFL